MAATKLTDKITAVADAIREKTGKSEKMTLAEMPAEIAGIKTGGGTVKSYEVDDVTFYDFDGTIIYSCSMADAQNLTKLPTPPEHEGLVFQEWNWTLEQIKSSSVGADVGAMYDTKDGAAEIYVKINDEYQMNNISVTIGTTVNTNGSEKLPCPTIDWGDGTETASSGDIETYNAFNHKYKNTGSYKIRIKRGSGGVFKIIPWGNTYGYSVFVSTESGWMGCIRKVIIGSDCTELGSYLFKGMRGLTEIVMHNNLMLPTSNSPFENCGISHVNVPAEQINLYNTFRDCKRLKSISVSGKTLLYQPVRGCVSVTRLVVPDSVSVIDSYSCYGCLSLRELKIGRGVWKIGSYAVATDNIISKLSVPASVTRIEQRGLAYMNEIKEYHFKSTTPPTMSSSGDVNIKTFGDEKTKIYVPAGCAEAYKSATNWAALADYIIEEGK